MNDEELLMASCGAEALINSRPSTYQPANVNDNVPLAPNPILLGQMGGFAPEAMDKDCYDPKKDKYKEKLVILQLIGII